MFHPSDICRYSIYERVKNPEKFNWTSQRKLAVRLISTGLYDQNEVAEKVKVYTQTISGWKQYPIFLQEVERLTLEMRIINRAGLIRETLHGLEIKRRNIWDDNKAHLDYFCK